MSAVFLVAVPPLQHPHVLQSSHPSQKEFFSVVRIPEMGTARSALLGWGLLAKPPALGSPGCQIA